jgi:hypothetical protein
MPLRDVIEEKRFTQDLDAFRKLYSHIDDVHQSITWTLSHDPRVGESLEVAPIFGLSRLHPLVRRPRFGCCIPSTPNGCISIRCRRPGDCAALSERMPGVDATGRGRGPVRTYLSRKSVGTITAHAGRAACDHANFGTNGDTCVDERTLPSGAIRATPGRSLSAFTRNRLCLAYLQL